LTQCAETESVRGKASKLVILLPRNTIRVSALALRLWGLKMDFDGVIRVGAALNGRTQLFNRQELRSCATSQQISYERGKHDSRIFSGDVSSRTRMADDNGARQSGATRPKVDRAGCCLTHLIER
jgi:hypothetical protein